MTVPLSQENAAILQYLNDAGVQFTYPSDVQLTKGTHVPTSYHKRQGTGAVGLAVDISSANKLAVFNALDKVYTQLAELIYDNPGAQNRNVKNGKHVPIYDHAANASTHVHVAVNRGTFIKYPHVAPTPPPNPGIDWTKELLMSLPTLNFNRPETLANSGLVDNVQGLLNAVGFAPCNCAIDNKAGPGTLAAVRAFQAHAGIGVDGIVGQTTWTKLITW